MPLNKQALNINFAQGLDNKTDDYQLSPGKFLALSNTVFDTVGRLTKRNGFGFLPKLPDSTATFLTTYNDNLTTTGTSLQAYSADTGSWVNKGSLVPVSLNTLPLVRSNLNQSQSDTAIAPNGLVCTVFTETGSIYKYVIADSATGQNIVAPTLITPSSGVVSGSPRVFVLGTYFIVVFTAIITATSHLQYIAISSVSPSTVSTPTDIASAYVSSTRLSWDGIVVNSSLFIAYNTTTGGQSVKVTYLSTSLGSPLPATTFAGSIATLMNLTADITNPASPTIWISFYDSAGNDTFTAAIDQNLNVILAPTAVTSVVDVLNLATTAKTTGTVSSVTILAEIDNTVTALGSIKSNFINTTTVSQAGTVGSTTVLIRSVGLASKAIIYNDVTYFLAIQSSQYQPTYFLINGSGRIITKIAYQNGGSYYATGLPSISLIGDELRFPYLIKDLIAAVNKETNPVAGTQTAGIYSQTGINLASVNFKPRQTAAEIGSNLNLSGGFIAGYDGYSLVEQGFFLYPENVQVSTSGTGGVITAQQYYYQALYEWSDNQGNIFRSAPSIPVAVTTSGATSSNTITVPTLRLTYKTANPVKIVIYRWSVAQQNYFQVTSITSPLLNDVTLDSVSFVDTLADSTILGNSLIYTTGGVIENIAPPASDILNLFNNRLWLVDSEDRNLLWYSKQVISATPVEMSDLFTLYVAPTTGVQGSTGPITALASMDDKQIVFKADAAYYINGIGPDNTGANSQYSDPIYITSSVGCTNPQSIALMPNGLMFQSNKGIWLLGRDLSTTYIGAPVETLTQDATVTSVVSVPGTNQIRFALDSGITVVYDYYVDQWATFSNSSLSSVIYNGLHTFINARGEVFQETLGKYLDGTSPVLLSLQTGWMNLAGQQGFERFYQALLLGTYYTPFKLQVQFSYDFQQSSTQSTMVTPDNYTAPWGGEQLWGSGQAWGGPGNPFKARIFPTNQKCETFQVTINEIYDSSFGVQAGAGLTLSGLTLVAGIKKGYRTSSSSRTFG